jgi:hypothetical protein
MSYINIEHPSYTNRKGSTSVRTLNACRIHGACCRATGPTRGTDGEGVTFLSR